MNKGSFKRTIALFTVLGVISSSVHAIFDSLTLSTWNPDGTKEIEVFTIGDSHIGGGDPNAENARRDAQDSELLQNALHTWSPLGIAYLGESNPNIAKKNNETRQKQLEHWRKNSPLQPPYWGVYYTIPEYIENNNKQLSNITFDMCDARGKAFFETKTAILVLREMFSRIKTMMEQDPSMWIEKNGLQQNMWARLENHSKVSTQEFLDELKKANQNIETSLSENFFDAITCQELQSYATSLKNGRTFFEMFFKDRGKSTFEELIQYIITTANLNKRNQINREEAFACMHDCLSLLTTFNTEYEKITNYVADAGFILALRKQAQAHKNIVIFVGNNHAKTILDYLNKYKKGGKAYTCFAQGTLEYQYTSSKHTLSHEQARNLLCIPFNKNFVPKEISLSIILNQFKQKTKPYLCANCPEISIDKKFSNCSNCKNTYYCSKDCQIADWKKQHKTNCKKEQIQEKKEQTEAEKNEARLTSFGTLLTISLLAQQGRIK